MTAYRLTLSWLIQGSCTISLSLILVSGFLSNNLLIKSLNPLDICLGKTAFYYIILSNSSINSFPIKGTLKYAKAYIVTPRDQISAENPSKLPVFLILNNSGAIK